MESNLPQKYKEGVISKIKNFFLKLFRKNDRNMKTTKTTLTCYINENAKQISKEKQMNTIDIMRKEGHINRQKEDILLQIEKNPELINDWPIEKLLKLEQIFDEKIAIYDNDIARLKGQL